MSAKERTALTSASSIQWGQARLPKASALPNRVIKSGPQST